MSKLIFKLRDVPEDEALDIRNLLNDNSIEFYETHAGNWGIAMAGIWIREDDQYSQAMSLINEYEVQRENLIQAEYAELEHTGHAPSLLSNLRESPLRFIVYIFSIFVILYISVTPFLNM